MHMRGIVVKPIVVVGEQIDAGVASNVLIRYFQQYLVTVFDDKLRLRKDLYAASRSPNVSFLLVGLRVSLINGKP